MRLLTSFIVLFLFAAAAANSSPRINFQDLLEQAEINPQIAEYAERLAMQKNLPIYILTPEGHIIKALGIEDGLVVYGRITNAADIYLNASVLSEHEAASINLDRCYVIYADKRVVNKLDNFKHTELSQRTGTNLVLVIESTFDKVYAFDYATGNVVDTNFITNPGGFGTPKDVKQGQFGRVYVSDQISDVVYEFSGNGTFLRTFAPSGGPNTNILNNMRGIGFKSFSNNLLVCNADNGNPDCVAQFDTSGTHIGNFIANGSGGVDSPFDIKRYGNNYIVSGSSGNSRLNKFDSTGAFVSVFSPVSTLFLQQMAVMSNGNLAVSSFSASTAGLYIYSPAGTHITTHTGITGNRGVYQLGSGNFLVTNSAGVHEIDDTTGVLIRTILSLPNPQFAGLFDPGLVTSAGEENIFIPSDYSLEQNYPNPFNPVTKIKFALPVQTNVKLNVYDASGRMVTSIINETKPAGNYEVSFDGTSLSSGIYFYTIEAGSFKDVKRMLMIK